MLNDTRASNAQPDTAGTRPDAEGTWLRTVFLPTSVVAMLALLVAVPALERLREFDIRTRESAFTLKTAEITLRIEERVKAYRQILMGARGLLEASERVSRDEWRSYVEALRLPSDYPGILGIGFATYIRSAQLRSLEEHIRAEGFPDFQVTPQGARQEYGVITLIEPFNWRNQRAFGFDMLSEQVRRSAMMEAIQRGLPALSGRVRLVQETADAPQAGVLLYLPLFRRGASLQSATQREKALLGWVYSPFRMGDLITGTLGAADIAVRLRIYDGYTTDAEHLLYDSAPTRDSASDFHGRTQLELDNRIWTLLFDSTEEPGRPGSLLLEQGAIVLIWALFVLLTASFFDARGRALALSRAGASLQSSEARYSTLVNLSLDGIAALDADLRFSFVNPRLQDLLGAHSDDLIGQPFTALWPDDPVRRQSFAHRLRRGEAGSFEQTLLTRRGRTLTVIVTDAPHLDASGQLREVILSITDISDRKASEERIHYLASHDVLTGLANRASFMERMGDSLLMAQRHQRELALLFLDLDHFKDVNDSLGHAAGDILLVEAARRMRQCLRASDLLGRQGGDEFLALLHDVHSTDEALAVADKIRMAISAPYLIEGHECRISVSIGVALYPIHGFDLDSLARQADAAMYRAKSLGRNGAALAHLLQHPEPGEGPHGQGRLA